MQRKSKPVANIQELRFKAAERLAALENGEITNSDAKAWGGLAMVIVKTCQIEAVNNSILGVTENIDFLTPTKKQIPAESSQADKSVAEIQASSEEDPNYDEFKYPKGYKKPVEFFKGVDSDKKDK